MVFKIILISFLSGSNVSFSIGYSAFSDDTLGDGFLFVFNIDKKLKEGIFFGMDMSIYKRMHHRLILYTPMPAVYPYERKENLFCISPGINLSLGKENNFKIGMRGMNLVWSIKVISVDEYRDTYYEFHPLIYVIYVLLKDFPSLKQNLSLRLSAEGGYIFKKGFYGGVLLGFSYPGL